MTRDEESLQKLLLDLGFPSVEVDKLSYEAQLHILSAINEVSNYTSDQAKKEYCDLRRLKRAKLEGNLEDNIFDAEQIKSLSSEEVKENLIKEYIQIHIINEVNDNY